MEKYAGPGQWNDPDMLAVGNHQMPVNEARSHFSMWCMLAAPLMAGNDLRDMSYDTREILTNKELIRVNQDKLGKQGVKIIDEGNFEVWKKELENGEVAISLLNRELKPNHYKLDWTKIKGINAEIVYSIKNLWTGKDVGLTKEIIQLEIPARDVVVFRLKPKK